MWHKKETEATLWLWYQLHSSHKAAVSLLEASLFPSLLIWDNFKHFSVSLYRRACLSWCLPTVTLTGIWQVLWNTNCNEPDESTTQYRLTPSLCAKSGHKQLPLPLLHLMEIPCDLSLSPSHTHTHWTHERWQFLNHAAGHTCAHKPHKILNLTPAS